MTTIQSNGSKWAGEELDSIEDLIEVLKTQTLNPIFEQYGDFAETDPRFYTSGELCYPDNPGTVHFFGNFYTVSHVFNIDTDDAETIATLRGLIAANKATAVYQQAVKELAENKSYWDRRAEARQKEANSRRKAQRATR
jgi:hypothetical protein